MAHTDMSGPPNLDREEPELAQEEDIPTPSNEDPERQYEENVRIGPEE